MMKRWLLLILCLFSSTGITAPPPPADDVFTVHVQTIDPNTFSVHWQIKPGYFLYHDRIKIEQTNSDLAYLGPIRFPPALKKTDRQGHTYSIYRQQLTLPVAVLGQTSGETLLKIHYQGCSDDGFCYPPETKNVKVAINSDLALQSVNVENGATKEINVAAPQEKSSNTIADIYAHSQWFMVILSFFGFGLLLAFTPCVLPMVPVLSGIIVGHGHDITTRKAFFLSLSYVLSMSLTYALAGAIVALLGQNLQVIMQAPWVIGFFSLIFVLLALSMFGYFELKLPVSWQAKLAQASRSQHGGHYLGAAVMGCLSTLILSPCVTAPLIGALGYIAQSGNVLFGTITLFFLGLGMGTPLLLIGTSAGKLLPKAGAWMTSVKNFFGILLLGVAIYLLGRLLPPPLTMLLWASLLVFSGIFMGALHAAQNTQERIHQSAGIILLVYGLLILTGASMGSNNPLQPLAGMFNQAIAAEDKHTITVKTIAEFDQALAEANGHPVMIDFYADWCSSCKLMEATTFKNQQVKHLLNKLVIIKVDVTANTRDQQLLMNRFNVIAPPTFLFLTETGSELVHLRLVGDTETPAFVNQLHRVLKHEAG